MTCNANLTLEHQPSLCKEEQSEDEEEAKVEQPDKSVTIMHCGNMVTKSSYETQGVSQGVKCV